MVLQLNSNLFGDNYLELVQLRLELVGLTVHCVVVFAPWSIPLRQPLFGSMFSVGLFEFHQFPKSSHTIKGMYRRRCRSPLHIFNTLEYFLYDWLKDGFCYI